MSLPFSRIPPAAEKTVTPFEVHIPQVRLDEMFTLLKLSKLAPETYENSLENRQYGVTRKWMIDAKSQWEKINWSLPPFSEHL